MKSETKNSPKKKLAVFISGGGTNLQAIIDSIARGEINASISLVISSDSEAYGLTRAKKHGIPVHVSRFTGETKERDYLEVKELLLKEEIDLIILAGFMKVIPAEFVNAFEQKIINLHPALLPRHGGIGMYGDNVHRAVLREKDKTSGATVHYVDTGCDTGEIIAQGMTNVYNDDNIESLSNRIHIIEHRLLPRVIADICE
ncbi:phosphoribosylglycinamide formyltransferase [Microaceticoccus formicicus]|uniref:phosphoribosylglycinamide formyltransferase n=1 Tax=Microaceticoccus formicicus TaxID=3118105 RepID=UPI003CD01CDD|nr:phosphoribosylglycinamide formyltransferase [Peptoniphilaceae bacterium AMB_02]